MAIEKLNIGQIKAARPVVTESGKIRPRRLADGGNLFAQIAPTKDGRIEAGLYVGDTAISWLFAYERDGQRHTLGGGSIDTRSLKEARTWARKQRQIIADGKDPLREKQDARQADLKAAGTKRRTYLQALTAYVSDKLGAKNGTTDAYAQQFLRAQMADVVPTLGKLYCDQIVGTEGRDLIVKAFRPIWNAKPKAAKRTLDGVGLVLAYASGHGWRPADLCYIWKKNLDAVFVKPARIAPKVNFAALPYKLIPEFMGQLADVKGSQARALELTILCASRVDEILSLRWRDVDLKDRAINFDAEYMKARRPHAVPLSTRAVELLMALPSRGEGPDALVFPGRFGDNKLDSKGVLRAAREILPEVAKTTHGFRSAFSDWQGDQTSFARDLREHALAHTITGVEGDYRRSTAFDARRPLMDAWAQWCSEGTVPAQFARTKAA